MVSDKFLKKKSQEKKLFQTIKNAETGRQKLCSRCFRLHIENSGLATQGEIRRVLVISSIM